MRALITTLMGWLALSIIALPATAKINEVEVIAQTIGTSPLDAQQKAVDYAQKRAFFLTLTKIAPQRAQEIAKSLTSEQIYSIVRGYELLDQRIDRDKPNHYLAKYKVSVSEAMVRRLLADDSAQEQEANPMLILPVYSSQDSPLLWEDENVWRSIWNSVTLETGQGVLVVPYGDPNDMLELNAANVLSANYAMLMPMLERYGAGEAVIAHAMLKKETRPAGLSLQLRRIGPEVNQIKQLNFQTDDTSRAAEALLPMAAREAATQLKEIARTYQGTKLRRLANANRLQLTARFNRLAQWVSIQEKLEALPRVIELRIENVSIDSAQATLLYETTPEMMSDIMTASGLFLQPKGKGAIEIRVP